MVGRQAKALVLDFDSTLSTPTWQAGHGKWAVADNRALFQAMTLDQQIANFGGGERIRDLTALLEALTARAVALYIVSIGYKEAFVPHLQTAGLLRFFDPERIYGQDSKELRDVGFVKGALIRQIMEIQGWAHDDVVFVDDSQEHIEKASQVCRTILVSTESKRSVGGIAQAEMIAIREACLGS
ncbi:hypothetical protein AB1Y20_003337 [Prymnesium parvum]|uniref:Uncharacterized protein n=1 Tax=Prymnesium parvum TaxID=97485 RepID=A0AB34JDX5_PRYPA